MDAESIREIFREVGEIRLRRMFGGQGIYRGETMFALEAGGEIYLKADSETAGLFEGLGSRPFTFTGRNGKPTATSYWRLPESALDDPEEAARFADLALAAAARKRAVKAATTGKRR